MSIGTTLHIDIEVRHLSISINRSRSCAIHLTINQRILFFRDIIHQHIIRLNIDMVIEVLEMSMIHSQIHMTGMIKLIIKGQITYLDTCCIQMNGI